MHSHQPGHNDHQIHLPGDRFKDCQGAGFLGQRQNITIAQGGDRNTTEVKEMKIIRLKKQMSFPPSDYLRKKNSGPEFQGSEMSHLMISKTINKRLSNIRSKNQA
jgi:hypothetical protein